VSTQRMQGLRRLVGNTPLLAIEYRWRGRTRTVYAKCEQLNLTGSIKDRMALHILDEATRSGRLLPGSTIVEASSGNTGISFAAIGRAFGHPVTIFMPDWMSRERTDLIASFGATIVSVSRDEGGFLGCIARAEAMAKEDPGVFLPSQFSNEANPLAHEKTTGREIVEQRPAGVGVDEFGCRLEYVGVISELALEHVTDRLGRAGHRLHHCLPLVDRRGGRCICNRRYTDAGDQTRHAQGGEWLH